MVAYSEKDNRMVLVDEINRSMVLPVDRDRVWQAITQPDELRQWFAPQCEFTLEIGSDITLTAVGLDRFYLESLVDAALTDLRDGFNELGFEIRDKGRQ